MDRPQFPFDWLGSNATIAEVSDISVKREMEQGKCNHSASLESRTEG
jgi:hypothetical protein